MRICTSRYQAQKQVMDSGLVPVGITVGNPRFKLQYKYVSLKLLAPTGHLFHIDEKIEFTRRFRAHLDQIGVEKIRKALEKISQDNGGRGLVLLCYEDVHKKGEWCHRRVFADWWTDRTGQVIEELPPPHRQLTLDSSAE